MSRSKRTVDSEITAEDGNELPEGWVDVSLAELLLSLEAGSRPSGGVRGIRSGVPSIGGEHLNDAGGFRFENLKYVPTEFFQKMSRGHIRPGDILIVKDGATTGKVSRVDASFPFQTAVVNEHVFICRPSPAVESDYLFRFLHSREGQRRVLENFRGSAQGGINQQFAENTAVPVPPLAEQRRIVEKVEALLPRVEAARTRLTAVTGTLKRFRQAVLAAACSGTLTLGWREENPVAAGFTAVREPISVRDDLPRAWKRLPVRELRSGPLANGKSVLTAAAGFPVLRLTAIRDGAVNLCERKTGAWTESEARKYLVKRDDFYVVRGNGSLALVGRGGLVIADPDGVAYPDTLIRLRCSPDLLPGYIRLAWDSSSVRRQIEYTARTSAGIFKISQSDIDRILLAVPPLQEQREIVRRVEALFGLADQVEERVAAAAARADRLAQAILGMAFRGELVAQEPEDEPAGTLVERVREAQMDPSQSGARTAAKTGSRLEVTGQRSFERSTI